MITSDETTDTLIRGLEMLQSVMPDNAFCGKGEVGPSVFKTDNCSELRSALNNVWLASRLLLCVFHLMQQV